MKKKTKRGSGKSAELHDIVMRHMEQSERLLALIATCRRQCDAGNVAAARKTLARIERLHRSVAAMEERRPAGKPS